MKLLLVICVLTLQGLSAANGQTQRHQSTAEEIQRSHIEGNVPDASAFKSILQRDLLDFVKAKGAKGASRVDYTLLRDAPTQSGVAYPKFYAWVKVYSGNEVLSQGAVRVAAVEGSRFDVTHFLDAVAIRTNPEALHSIFPAALVPVVIERAKAT